MTTVVLMWCRSRDENIIGIGNNIPWNEPEDSKNFWDVVENQVMVMGRKTFESLPYEKIKNHKIYIMSQNKDYEVLEKQNHLVITSQKELKDVEGDLYIAGGSYIYELFLKGKEALKPHIIVDCVYEGEVFDLEGEKITISACMDEVNKKYRRISSFYKKGNVVSSVKVRKNEFVEQSVLKRIVKILENGAEVV